MIYFKEEISDEYLITSCRPFGTTIEDAYGTGTPSGYSDVDALLAAVRAVSGGPSTLTAYMISGNYVDAVIYSLISGS